MSPLVSHPINGVSSAQFGEGYLQIGITAFNDEYCSLSGINVLLYLPLLRVSAKGDFLYNCCSVATTGNESLGVILRLLTSIELH